MPASPTDENRIADERALEGDSRESPIAAALLDRLLDALASERRQHVLDVLYEHAETLALGDVAEEVAERETGEPFVEIPDEYVTEIHHELYHEHAPKLASANVVSFEESTGLIRLFRPDH